MEPSGSTPLPSSAAKQKTDDEFWSLTENAYFSVVLAKSHVRPYWSLPIPVKGQQIIPSLNLPVTLTYHGRNWEMNYFGKPKWKRFDYPGWRTFCNDNNLMAGDACVFELIESSSQKLRFGVQILQGGIPVELSSAVRGMDANNPILIE